MGQIADDIRRGFMCADCGIIFIVEHGHPVLCEECHAEWKSDPHISDDNTYPKAHHPELDDQTDEELAAYGSKLRHAPKRESK